MNGVKYYHKDHLGSSTVITAVTGGLINKTTYAPYGSETLSQGSANVAYKFTDKEKDNTGLIYFGARYYDPEIGRFITVDPMKDGLNWYAYAANNPINNIDPNGFYTLYRVSGGRTCLENTVTGELKMGTLYKVQMSFSNPVGVLVKTGLDAFTTKNIQAAILGSELTQDLLAHY